MDWKAGLGSSKGCQQRTANKRGGWRGTPLGGAGEKELGHQNDVMATAVVCMSRYQILGNEHKPAEGDFIIASLISVGTLEFCGSLRNR